MINIYIYIIESVMIYITTYTIKNSIIYIENMCSSFIVYLKNILYILKSTIIAYIILYYIYIYIYICIMYISFLNNEI